MESPASNIDSRSYLQRRLPPFKAAAIAITDTGDRSAKIQVGDVARTANGSVLVRSGDAVLLVTAHTVPPAVGDRRFRIDYRRERDEEVTTRRRFAGLAYSLLECLISKSVSTVMGTITVTIRILSYDPAEDNDSLAFMGIAAALAISDIPITYPVGIARLRTGNCRYFGNERPEFGGTGSDVLLAVSQAGIVALHACASGVNDVDILDSVRLAREQAQQMLAALNTLVLEVGRPKMTSEMQMEEHKKRPMSLQCEPSGSTMQSATAIPAARVIASWLPRCHGSAVISDDNSQAIAIARLIPWFGDLGVAKSAVPRDVNVTLYSPPVKSAVPMYADGFIERSLLPLYPRSDAFPYQTTIFCEGLESDRIDVALATCASSVALLDSGVPFVEPIAAVRVGTRKSEHGATFVADLSIAEEDTSPFLFTVAGTRNTITALEIEASVPVSENEVAAALAVAHVARSVRIDEIEKALPVSHGISPFAPRVYSLQIPTSKIRDLIGPGGRVVRGINERCGVDIQVGQDGKVRISAEDEASANKAIQTILDLTCVAEVGKIYMGTVLRLTEFGAFVELFPGTDGLLHISEISENKIKDVREELKEGDQIAVKVLQIDGNKIKLSRKAAMKEQLEKTRIKPT